MCNLLLVGFGVNLSVVLHVGMGKQSPPVCWLKLQWELLNILVIVSVRRAVHCTVKSCLKGVHFQNHRI